MDSTDQNGTRALTKREICHLQYRDETLNTGVFCEAIWDSFYCWPATPAGEMALRSCSEIFTHNHVPINVRTMEKAYAYRYCNENGDWLWGEWTNYTECLELLHQDNFSSDQIAVAYILFVGSIVSLVALILTLSIFCYFKSLHCPRLHVHQNLVIALIIHSILLFVISTPGVLQDPALSYGNIDWLCKSILSIKMYAAMASINWMFVEGLLLHSRITVSVFNMDTPFKLYYLLGWVLPAVFIISWAAVTAKVLDTPCWRGYGKSSYIWIITGPMLTALTINTIFLVNIVRILVTKLKMSVSIETAQVRKAIKATALLFPLLGITHLLFCINPRDHAYLEKAYMFTNAFFQSWQGVFVAVLYCFTNSEVQSALRNAYLRVNIRWHQNTSHLARRYFSQTSTNYSANLEASIGERSHHKVSPCANISLLPLHDPPETKQFPTDKNDVK
ncbi:corticotropin-releasing factor receptor 1-like [Limulus polyphemus]|uniref:Corticotropin-releasing factor receptor 1-like n=1 Tax=Limulus polyphemus TaxID=6850 RepID=A0A1B0YZ31_LIMPO|nr:corticotropin-releasing factor receptor 1-like [Limulus polyphemus]ANO53993.1 PDHR1 [Limulus polyphemus]